MEALAEAELDDVADIEEAVPIYDPNIREGGSVQLSTCQEPVMVQAWPLGLALASAPNITVAVTATASGFQKVVSLMACLKLPFRSRDYKVETNQFEQGVASIRAQPQVTFGTCHTIPIKLYCICIALIMKMLSENMKYEIMV